MLDQAPRHPNIEYRTIPAESSGLGSGTADLVTVAQALHWFDTSLFYSEAERVLPAPSFEMQAHWTLEQLLGYVGTWSATQRYREVLGSDPVAQLREQLARHWGDAGTVRSVTWPLSLRVGRRP
jgi:hypothetical protein